ncbi:hypothetical protein [Sphingobacterium thalpophilum]|uniref:Uncharacterized protein n=1 Tax=Sphingobacterium thalpophilum TaxID=259 RepID=A0A4U9VD74_9SPHI|nr:hypothetical protein [Sphingobacterium thalpophilum]VTR44855.1 Uncharacterised protein [Sphingobacterium thalpophilum]
MKYQKKIMLFVASCLFVAPLMGQMKQYSGIYPHLAMYNDEGECGVGAVVPWNNSLYVVTYGPHLPLGSSDKLYKISRDFKQKVMPQSIGGTPANRFVHRTSNQLLIGPYIIDKDDRIRVIPVKDMPGRLTGTAAHLFQPDSLVYYGTMEEGFYSVNVYSGRVEELYTDGNFKNGRYRTELAKITAERPQKFADLPGAHGKGLYSGQGVLVYSNNGEPGELALQQFDIPAGSLSEWDGKNWKLVRRNQFVEITGPGGLSGNADTKDPIWATGWDHKSAILATRDYKLGWRFYRFPKSSHSYDGAHGWNTEWPRIRDIGTADNPYFLMTMHGMFWHFPRQFSVESSAGLRPLSSYLKVIGDFARWNNELVFGCDDSAQKEFLNKRGVKGQIEGPGQSNSNLWFTSLQNIQHLGNTTAEGAVWLNEEVKKNDISEPFLFAGWPDRTLWIKNEGNGHLLVEIELDRDGTGEWRSLGKRTIEKGKSLIENFAADVKAEWIRLVSHSDAKLTAQFTFKNIERSTKDLDIFEGIAKIGDDSLTGGLMAGLGNNKRTLGIVSQQIKGDKSSKLGYYELTGDMKLLPQANQKDERYIENKFALSQNLVQLKSSSILIVDDKGRRWRFPKGDKKYDDAVSRGLTRICREVATERDLLNLHGTFYELPAENADGFAKVRPIASHDLNIMDYASYRGLLVFSGIKSGTSSNTRIIRSVDNKCQVWVGTIDDLWKLGKPQGDGGPLDNEILEKGKPSDPYLFGFYEHRTLTLSNHDMAPVKFTIQMDPVGNGTWMDYEQMTVKGKGAVQIDFPKHLEARWIRFTVDRDCRVSTLLKYD